MEFVYILEFILLLAHYCCMGLCSGVRNEEISTLQNKALSLLSSTVY